MNIDWLLAWWNLIFIVPGFLALMYLGVYTLSGWTFDADHDVDTGVDTDADVDADFDADVDADVDHDLSTAEHDASIDHEVEGTSQSAFLTVLDWIGVGRVPLSILLMVWLLTWGASGFMIDAALRSAVHTPWMVSMASIPGALFISVIVTRGIATLLGTWMPINESYARARHELLGFAGEALYPIDENFGMAAVRDNRGGFFQLACRIEPGRTPIPKGNRVLLVGYNAKDKLFRVIPDDTAETTVHDSSKGGIL